MRGGAASGGWGEVGWGQEEVRVTRRARDQRPPRPGHTGDRETDASSAHHAPEAGPTAPVSFSAQPSPHPSAHTRARAHTLTHTHGQGHKVACLLQWGQEDHQHRGAGPCLCWPRRPPARGLINLAEQALTTGPPTCLPSFPCLGHCPNPKPSLVIRNPARRSGLGRAGGEGAGEMRAEGGRGGGEAATTSVRLTASRPLPEPRWTGIW